MIYWLNPSSGARFPQFGNTERCVGSCLRMISFYGIAKQVRAWDLIFVLSILGKSNAGFTWAWSTFHNHHLCPMKSDTDRDVQSCVFLGACFRRWERVVSQDFWLKAFWKPLPVFMSVVFCFPSEKPLGVDWWPCKQLSLFLFIETETSVAFVFKAFPGKHYKYAFFMTFSVLHLKCSRWW